MRPSESNRAGRRAWLRSISASSPRASGSSVARVSWRASRIASRARSDPAGVAGRVDEVEHAQHDGEVTGLVQAAAVPAGSARLARLIRCAIVASGT